jgi:hypothetical protein
LRDYQKSQLQEEIGLAADRFSVIENIKKCIYIGDIVL